MNAKGEKTEVKKIKHKDELVHQSKSTKDKLLWIVVFVLLILAIGSNYYFSLPPYQLMPVIRVIGVAVLMILAFIFAVLTQKGRFVVAFARESRSEMRKVVWPTKKVTLQTTMIVAVVTTVTSVALWGLDSLLISFVYYITTLGH